MAQVTVETVKQHSRIDFNEEDSVIKMYMNAAISYIYSMTFIENDGSNEEDYVLAVCQLAALYYSHREAAIEVKLSELPYGTHSFINRKRNEKDFF